MIIKKMFKGKGCNECKLSIKEAKRKGISIYTLKARKIDVLDSYHFNLCESCLKNLYLKLKKVFG
jgi:hypothetical protein